ncbi:CD63 antigen [Orchesella cincta]|uniref:CD63 antigen n=1 Tax=Orchesella cincta TaxID=48709 RepID=A0A1D2MG20_ORCCI|nr:CD63 antigen [Orchesella cincta]
MMENCLGITSFCAFIAPFFLGILMIWGAFAAKNGIIWYFARILDYEGVQLTNFTIPLILLIVAGVFTFLLIFFLVVTVNERKNNFSIFYLVMIGCTMALEISALTMLFKNDADGMPENTMYNSMGNYYNEGSPSQNVSVQFWNYMQDNLKCCGIYGYTDWVAASQAPEVGFIPKSCCIGDNQTSESCTEVITKDKINSVAFIKNTIYMDGCLSQYNSFYGIGFLELTAILVIFCQVCGLVTACGVFISKRSGYENLAKSTSVITDT